MPDMRLSKLLKADILNHLQQANQPSPKPGWQRSDFGIGGGDSLDRPVHPRLYSISAI